MDNSVVMDHLERIEKDVTEIKTGINQVQTRMTLLFGAEGEHGIIQSIRKDLEDMKRKTESLMFSRAMLIGAFAVSGSAGAVLAKLIGG